MEDEEPPAAPLETYLPGTKLAEGEQLVADQSVYLALHSMSYAWPCLSFDVLRDDLGSDRSKFPHTAWVVTGTQAGEVPGQGRAKDEVVIMRLGGLSKTQHDDDDSDAEDEDDDDEGTDEDATLDFLTIPHVGSVNRIRAAPAPAAGPVPDPYHVATFSETGKVHIFDVRPYIDSLAGPSKPRQKVPVHTINAHGREEGFAVEWGHTGLLTGDLASRIYLTTVTPTGFHTSPQAYKDHTSSIEDLQWSPAEPTVFASASADRTVKVWDIRAKARKAAVSVKAHEQDVNVISWNKGTDYLMVSGGDEGGLKVWDLRMFGKGYVFFSFRTHSRVMDDTFVESAGPTRFGKFTLERSGQLAGSSDLRKLVSIQGIHHQRHHTDQSLHPALLLHIIAILTHRKPQPVADFTWHTAPITSVEWHPSDPSVFAASGADDQTTLWDLSVEGDEDEAPIVRQAANSAGQSVQVPPQLLFVHQGQKDVKEIHWHPQIPGMVLSTAGDSFNAFKTISV